MRRRAFAGPIAGCLAAVLSARVAAAQGASTVVVAAGDIACDPADVSYNGGLGVPGFCQMKATSDAALALAPDVVLVLGDNQYEDGSLAKYQASYHPSWGRLKPITKPSVGNHEYLTGGAAGYFAYFGAAAGDPAKGYYAFDLPGWRVFALNSNCAAVGGCGAGSPQEQWLRADLAAHPGVCTLAYWHHPRFSSGAHNNDALTDAFWRALYDYGADVVLNGHDHDYERFHRQTPDETLDPALGIRAFVVGTGGKNQTPFATLRPTSAARSTGVFGVLKLTLRPGAYDWEFVSASGGTFVDQGSTLCHRAEVALKFHTLPPCRVVDTRGPAGPTGGPSLAAGTARTFPIASACGVPAWASAVALNLTVVSPTVAGDLRLYPGGEAAVPTSVINFPAGKVRANNAVARLGAAGSLALQCDMASGGVHVVMDVAGYFAP